MSNQNNENAALSTVQVHAAAPGSQVVVDASGASRIAFDFDITSASMSRSGNDLLFETENGGSVRITNFFAPADGMNLPEFVLADNTVVDSKDLLAAYDIDATPAAAAAPGGGLGEYNSDPGNLIGGLDGSGDLDAFFWGANAAQGEDFVNNRYPGGSFDLSISTDLGGAFSAVLYEDARPDQNIGDNTVMAGRINMNINPNSGSTVGEIRFSGLPAGAKLYLGDPASGGQEVLPDAGGVYHFNASDFASGVYITPPADSDLDIRINVSVDFSDSGRVATVSGGFTVIVDAVADQPYTVSSDELGITNDQHSMSSATVNSDFVDGFNTQDVTIQAANDEGKVSVTLEVTSRFSDYDPADGSETHYVLVELPEEFTDPAGYDTYTDPVNGTVYIMVPADSAINPNTGEATVSITLDTASYSVDATINLKTGSMAVENASDVDFNPDNDVSVVIDDAVQFSLDVVDATLNVSMGWASEGDNAGGHLGSGTYSQNFGNMNDGYSDSSNDDGATGLDGLSTNGLGAPIVIELDGASGAGSGNSITEVALTLEAGRGVLVDGSGNVISPDTPGGNTYTFSDDISAGKVYFQPNAGSFNNSDVTVSYQVTVKNAEGATGVYTGTASVVVDAVADFAPVSNLTVEYGVDTTYNASMSAAKPGGTVELKMDVNFPDTTAGNENHYVLIAANVANIAEYGAYSITDASGTVLASGQLSALTPNADGYYEIVVDSSVSDVKVSVEVTVSDTLTQDTNISVGMGSKTEALESFTNDGDKEYDSANNVSTNLSSVTVAVDPSNASYMKVIYGTYEADANGVINAGKHGATQSFEIKMTTDTSGSGGYWADVKAGESWAGDIIFALKDPGQGAGEYSNLEAFTKIVLIVEGNVEEGNPDALGILTLKGADSDMSITSSYDAVTGLTTVTITDTDTDTEPSLHTITVNFKPTDAYSDADLKIVEYTATYKNYTSHDSQTFNVQGTSANPAITVNVDAVAARATGLKTEDADYAGDQTKAKAGEEVTVKFEMTVPEADDPNEVHGLTLKIGGNGGYNSVTLHGGSEELVITFDAPQILQQYAQADNIKVNGVDSTDFTVEVISINGYHGTGVTYYYKISGPGFESYVDEVGGAISGEISFNASNVTGDGSQSGSVGLVVYDAATTGSAEVANQNNVSYNETTYTYEVGVVGSGPSVAVGQAFENAAKDSNGGFVSRAELLAALADSDPAVAAEALAQLKASSAFVTVSGTSADESITKAVFVADYPDAAGVSGDNEAPGQFMYQGVLIGVPTDGPVPVNGVTITCELGADGQVTITLEGENIDLGPDSLYFVPGENYNHNDVTVNYGITVTDNGSDQDKVFSSDHNNPDLFPGTGVSGVDYDPNEGAASIIVVDAVAQRPDLEEASIEVLQDAEVNTLAHGATAKITIPVDLHGDIDGTEGHFFYVKTIGNSYPVQAVTITYMDAGGNEHSFTLPANDLGLQRTTLGGEASEATYHSINLEAEINAQVKADPDNYPPLGRGEITIMVEVGTPSSGPGSTVSYGVCSHEDWYDVRQGWENGSDTEADKLNNNAWNSGSIGIKLSSASTPYMSVDNNKVDFYENNNATANEGTYQGGVGVPLSFNFGDSNDILTGFNVSISGANGPLGDLIMFESAAVYQEFVAAVGSDTSGRSAHEILQDFIDDGKAQNMGDSITFGDIDGMVGKNGDGELTGGFTGKIVFMPSEDSYSGQDPQIDCTIQVRDGASGEYVTGGSRADLVADAVAQKPDVTEVDTTPPDLGSGQYYTNTITATFGDADATEHYILVEAKAGWKLIYSDGTDEKTLSMDDLATYTEGGVVYYKIPVTPVFKDPDDPHDDPNIGTASVTIGLEPPTNSLYYYNQATNTFNEDFSFDVRAGSTDNDLNDEELTFHNNTAISDSGGSIDINREWNPSGHYHFWQLTPLYEDNNPDSHLANEDLGNDSTGGTFLIGATGCAGGYALIECPVDGNGDPVFNIAEGTWNGTAWEVNLGPTGSTTITVTLSQEYLDGGGAHDDVDLSFGKVTFVPDLGGGGGQPIVINEGFDVVVDAVADRANLQDESVKVWDSATDANRLDDAVAGGSSIGEDDFTAKFTVNATFPDTIGEDHYILVEKIPSWECAQSSEEVHIDGKTYYKIDVTDEVNPDGSLSYEVEMQYVGVRVDLFDTGNNGVKEHNLSYGTMSQEGVSDGEGSLQNNIAVNLEGAVTLKYSPVTSSIDMTVTHTSNVEREENSITLQLKEINTSATQDELIDLSISYGPAEAGTLWLVDGSDNQLYEINSGHPFTDAELAGLSNGGYKLVFEQTAYNHQDISFSWSGTVKDMVSGATVTKSGGTTIVMDADAQNSSNDYANNSDGSIVVEDKTTGATGVQSGGTALVTIKADFPDQTNVDDPSTPGVQGSEEHWVVLEQGDLDYNVLKATVYDVGGVIINDATVVTKFGPDGTPYFAVQVPAGTGIKVVFEVTTPSGLTSDTEITLNGGTITIDNTKNGADGEADYDNNWSAKIGQDAVEIQVGVLETENVTVTAQTNISEGGYSQLSFAGIEAGYNEEAVITLDLPSGVALYASDGSGGYNEVTGSPLTITYHNDNGTMVPDQDYYLKADDHYSGNVTIKYTVEVTDVRTGESTSIAEQSAAFNIKGVASGSELDSGSYTAQDAAAAHAASVTITPHFDDADGSEAHYLLFAVPAGIQVDGATAFILNETQADALGLAPGTYYRMVVTGQSGDPVTVNLNSVSGYDAANDSISVWSMSEENGGFAISDESEISVGDLNSAVTATEPTNDVTAGVESDWTVCGDLGLAAMFNDPDGDSLSYSFNYGGNDYALDPANGVDIPGQYGTLHINADGTYTYTPDAGEANDSFHAEAFSGITVTATDGYGSSVDSAVNLSLDAPLSLYGGAGVDDLTADSAGLTVYGGAGDDTITAHDGGTVIFGGLGDDTMYAGAGGDVFAWRDGDLDSGIDTIVGFDMTSDKLFIEGLLGDNPADQESELVGLLSDGDLLLSMNDASTLTLQYGDQTVKLELSENVDTSTFNTVNDNSGDSDTAKAQLLMNILNSSM